MDFERKKVVEYLVKYKESWPDYRGLKAILSDCIPQNKAYKNVMLVAYEEGAFSEFSEHVNDKIVTYRIKKKIINNHAISEEAANSRMGMG